MIVATQAARVLPILGLLDAISLPEGAPMDGIVGYLEFNLYPGGGSIVIDDTVMVGCLAIGVHVVAGISPVIPDYRHPGNNRFVALLIVDHFIVPIGLVQAVVSGDRHRMIGSFRPVHDETAQKIDAVRRPTAVLFPRPLSGLGIGCLLVFPVVVPLADRPIQALELG